MKWWISAVVLALLALAGWVSMEFRRGMQRHGERVRHGSRMLQTACGDIELGEAGPPDGLPLLMIHGSGGGFDQGLTLGRDLAARGLRVIAPSRFGDLRTPFPDDPSRQRQADRLARLLDAMGLARRQ